MRPYKYIIVLQKVWDDPTSSWKVNSFSSSHLLHCQVLDDIFPTFLSEIFLSSPPLYLFEPSNFLGLCLFLFLLYVCSNIVKGSPGSFVIAQKHHKYYISFSFFLYSSFLVYPFTYFQNPFFPFLYQSFYHFTFTIFFSLISCCCFVHLVFFFFHICNIFIVLAYNLLTASQIFFMISFYLLYLIFY